MSWISPLPFRVGLGLAVLPTEGVLARSCCEKVVGCCGLVRWWHPQMRQLSIICHHRSWSSFHQSPIIISPIEIAISGIRHVWTKLWAQSTGISSENTGGASSRVWMCVNHCGVNWKKCLVSPSSKQANFRHLCSSSIPANAAGAPVRPDMPKVWTVVVAQWNGVKVWKEKSHKSIQSSLLPQS